MVLIEQPKLFLSGRKSEQKMAKVKSKQKFTAYHVHSVAKVYAVFPFYDVKCLSMFWRAGMKEGGKPLPLAFQYLIFMV